MKLPFAINDGTLNTQIERINANKIIFNHPEFSGISVISVLFFERKMEGTRMTQTCLAGRQVERINAD